MTMDDIDHVAVLGAGNMGHGITEVVALAGYDVTMRDVETEFVNEGYENIEWSLQKLHESGRLEELPDEVLARIETTVDLEAVVSDADLVIEAAPEDLDLKREIFADLDEYAPDGAILASNTSSLPITDIAAATDRPESVVGTHFFNPPVKMDLVEVIYGERTSEETAETAQAFVESIDKTPIYVRKDVHGFVVNNVLGPFGEEAAWMVSEGVAEIREADATMVHERGYPMGPFELGDLTGIDVSYRVRAEAGRPVPPILQSKVDAGELGRKTGKGYYDYENGDGVDYTPEDASEDFDWLRIEARILNEAAKLIDDDVATPEAIDTGLRLGAGFPEGPCRRADEVGLDAVLEKLDELYEAYGEDRYEASPYLRDLVEAGRTGKTTGAGFYQYAETDGGTDADESGVFHEIEVGDTDVTDGRTITEADVANFAGVSGDFNHIHMDEERMRESIFGERIAHGMLVLSAATGLIWQYRSIEMRDSVVAFYGLDDLRFRKPVYIGDTIHVEMEVVETTPRPEGAGNGTVTFALEIKNQRDEVVISCEMTSLLE
ncbi:MAG: 3-hydroxyacyl-CoA dehydrogenase NAD-binding domain-containing protein [Natronomonas sp.]|uniref:3-hydroxyacyl-CoA dehydrogenase NAD-binding domain-containing protein n=1 Tax=Natronomonas sp. TaxID=2184060 RepID=UPI0028700943|nr:3-hydroxyacyl-CoA dehydrogenase NAD-binding domain-containing protein [Natronomonas sp.]MDR9381022.1 3-hydroxyacyl-CoA dehydrogenase NAD-binding domain-containing protein [Natronomonas sp.]MDR9431444.1 3-hydroxyacyl-CoA dehydrogenase NAD-binding domain-containing protein [Natronomonas sp.]